MDNQNKSLHSISYYMILTGSYTGMRHKEIVVILGLK